MRFRFDLGELAPREPELRVVPSTAAVPEAAVEMVAGGRRPRWLPPLLPVFTARCPMHVAVLSAGCGAWSARLSVALAALTAMASEPSAVRVMVWPDGFAVGPPGFEAVPPAAVATVIAAECERGSIAAAAGLVHECEPEGLVLALHGDVTSLDSEIGLRGDLKGRVRLVRFPLLGRRELAMLGGSAPRMERGPFTRAALGLARAVVERYREADL